MARALTAVGALLALAFIVLALVVYRQPRRDAVAVDDLLSLELTRAIDSRTSGRGRRAPARALRLGPACSSSRPDAARGGVRRRSGSRFSRRPAVRRTGPLLVFADGDSLVRYADYRGRGGFEGFEEPVDELPRADAVLEVDGAEVAAAALAVLAAGAALRLRLRARLRLRLARVLVRALVARLGRLVAAARAQACARVARDHARRSPRTARAGRRR